MKRTFTIGVLIGNANSPHTMEVMRGIQRAAEQWHVNILFFLGIHSSYYYRMYFGDEMEDNFDYQFNTIYDYAWLGKVDALIISYGSLGIFLRENDKEKFLQRFSGIPYVLLEERDETHKGTSIISDNRRGMRELTEHLVKHHGYRNFLYLSGPASNTDAEERKAGVLEVLAENGIAMEPDRIENGDFTSCVERQVNDLLDRHPDAEVLMCANDVMADTAYKECVQRGLVIGEDIAITGYDNWEVAETMNPPLTTVIQNGYDMGYMSVRCAVDRCLGLPSQEVIAPAKVIYRASCGCMMDQRKAIDVEIPYSRSNLDDYTAALCHKILDKIVLSNTNEEIVHGVYNQFYQCMKESIKVFFSEDWRQLDTNKMIQQIHDVLSGDYAPYISPNSLVTAVNGFFTGAKNRCQNPVKRERLAGLQDSIQGAIKSFQLKASTDKYATFQQETWFMPLISRDMMNHIDNEQEFYRGAMKKISVIRSKSAYLYIFDEPIVHKENDEWRCPERLYLAACHEGDKVIAYKQDERPVITRNHGIISSFAARQNRIMSAFNLFSGEVQYGLLLSEINPEDMPLIYLASMQIGIALHFHDVSGKQKEAQTRLECLVKEVNEKNEVLNFISEYDALTGCLNRRGFMERAVALNQNNVGKTAVLIFGDLDHLKEINDTFGHMEGDFAI